MLREIKWDKKHVTENEPRGIRNWLFKMKSTLNLARILERWTREIFQESWDSSNLEGIFKLIQRKRGTKMCNGLH
jgi:hypothetical protein